MDYQDILQKIAVYLICSVVGGFVAFFRISLTKMKSDYADLLKDIDAAHIKLRALEEKMKQ